MNWKKSIFGGLCFVLSACAGQQIDAYKDNTPKLDLRQYLNGELEAWGVLHGRDGRVKRTFTVAMKASWKGNEGTLEEHFTFNDGEKSSRTWKVHYENDEIFTASAHDVVGTARGIQKGNAANMRYTLRVPVDGKEYDIQMDDWLYLVDGKRLINRTNMTKFGVSVGTLSIAFVKK